MLKRLIILAALIAAVTTVRAPNATAEGFEPYYPANDLLRRTIFEAVERQTLRPPVALSQMISDALRSIREIEGQTDPTLAGLLSTRLKDTWMDLERSWRVGELGYLEFDVEAFRSATERVQEVLSQFVGARDPYPAERYQTVMKTLTDAQALSRNARRPVPGLSSDDVELMQDKRWFSLRKTLREFELPKMEEPRRAPQQR